MSESDRLARKRQKTQRALLDAARELVYERGHDRVAISDITERADVGLGTFYNYFESKPAIFEAVLDDIQARFREQLGCVRQPLKDPALIVSHTLRFCLHQAQTYDEWNSFLKYSGLSGDYMLAQDEQQCLEDLARGAAAGRFKLEDVEFARTLILGIMRQVTAEIAEGRRDMSAIEEATRYILRMLGMPDLVAKALVQTPLPPTEAPRKISPPIPFQQVNQA